MDKNVFLSCDRDYASSECWRLEPEEGKMNKKIIEKKMRTHIRDKLILKTSI